MKRYVFVCFSEYAFYISSWLLVNTIEFRCYPMQIAGCDSWQFEVFTNLDIISDALSEYIHGKVYLE